MSRALPTTRRRFSVPATRIAPFLIGTVVLALWLGYQALDAALSHRRIAEAVLFDYAQISATAMAQEVDGEMDGVLEDIFDPIYEASERRRRKPSPELLRESIVEALDEERCDCSGLRDPLAVFRVAADSGDSQILSDGALPFDLDILLARLREQVQQGGDFHGMLMLPADEVGTLGVAVGYALPDPDEEVEDIYGFVVPTEALAALFHEWYEDETLLPQAIVGELPNDSLLHVSVFGPDGEAIYTSRSGFATQLAATAPVSAEFGGLAISAAVRPDAASQFIIGGLPRSRLPLLSVLLLLTVGVGIAAALQVRQEQNFQRLRDDFVSGVSHELRTPLAQIRMFAELQHDGKLKAPKDAARANAAIFRESVRLSHLVENILQFSRLGRLPEGRLQVEPLVLPAALHDGIHAVKPILEDQGMRLEVDSEGEIEILGNAQALTRVIVNLLDNAVKYGPKGQTVVLAIRQSSGSAHLSVTDEGPGVPPHDRQRIWQAYHRLERDVNSNVTGTGIGLSVVSDLAKLQGGRAWVERAQSGGARFVVQLPLSTTGQGHSREAEDEDYTA